MSNPWLLVFVCFICIGTAGALAPPPIGVRRGTKSHAVITGIRDTGPGRGHLREVELDLMVSRPEGGQFPAREVALIQASALAQVHPAASSRRTTDATTTS